MSLDGKETTLRESLDGQVVLVNFWTSWCQPCKVEMPDLQELHDTFAARGDMPRQFSVIGVAVDDNLPAIQKFIAETGISFPVYYDKGGLSTTRYALAGFPESVFLDADGRVLMVMDPQSGEPVTKIIGPRSWAAAASVRLVQSLIERVM
jgi:thiol-disulfide isomerase/thioredoxin